MSDEFPTQIGPYEVMARLGGGGMGELYLVRQEGAGGFRRYLALKAIKPQLARNPHFVNMFLDEARLAARIQHDNVVRVEHVAHDAGRFYLVMEFLPSVTLLDLRRELKIRGRRLDPALAASIVCEAALGLHAAHELHDDEGQPVHLVHRDVSPSNVLLGQRGEVKVIDFGIAKARGRLYTTAPNLRRAKGKMSYMSPEQFKGALVDRRSDIYALGVVLWELLTMERLYHETEDLLAMRRAMEEEHDPPGAYVEIPNALDEVVLSCLSIDVERRPSTAWELRTRLRAAVPSCRDVEAPERARLIRDVYGTAIADHLRELGVPSRASLVPSTAEKDSALARWTLPLERSVFDAAATQESPLPTRTPSTPRSGLGPSSGLAPIAPPRLDQATFDPPLLVPREQSDAPDPASLRFVATVEDSPGTRPLLTPNPVLDVPDASPDVPPPPADVPPAPRQRVRGGPTRPVRVEHLIAAAKVEVVQFDDALTERVPDGRGPGFEVPSAGRTSSDTHETPLSQVPAPGPKAATGDERSVPPAAAPAVPAPPPAAPAVAAPPAPVPAPGETEAYDFEDETVRSVFSEDALLALDVPDEVKKKP